MEDIIFSKELSRTDLTHRLVFPSKDLKKIANLSHGEEKWITVMDTAETEWPFRLSTRAKGEFLKPVISGKEWLQFVRQKHLQEGDKIILFREMTETNEVRLRIKIEYFELKTKIFGAPIRRADVESGNGASHFSFAA